MSKSRLFGTDGIRGRANRGDMKPENVMRLGMAVARALRKPQGHNTILIAKDTRLSGYMYENALTAGICSMGMNVALVGPLPTPGVPFLTRALRLDAGIAISASHNPYEDNGIKIFSHDGLKLPDSLEDEIEDMVRGEARFQDRPTGEGIGRAHRIDDATGRYIEYIKSTVPKGLKLDGMRVVVDSANGAAYKVTPMVLRELGAEVISINDAPDGMNINEGCGSLHIEALARAVLKHGADAGIAHDGDADRTLMCDETGALVDGDHIMGIWASELKERDNLPDNTIVSTVMSNLGLEKYLAARGIRMLRTKVGDRYVTELMLKEGYIFGGEQSGHIVMFDHNSTGDGPITALHMLQCMRRSGRALSSLAAELHLYPQILINVPVAHKEPLAHFPSIGREVEAAEARLGDRGRVLVRPSGTEPMVRVMLEGEDRGLIERLGASIADVIRAEMS